MIYRQASASTLKPLDAVYHSALRFITGDVYSTHHIQFDKVGWSSLSYGCDLFIYEALIGNLPLYITSVLYWSSGPYQTWPNDWLSL